MLRSAGADSGRRPQAEARDDTAISFTPPTHLTDLSLAATHDARRPGRGSALSNVLSSLGQTLATPFGGGYTQASGSSSSAVACAAVKNGLCDHGAVMVRMPGGALAIEVRPDWSIRLEGPVEEVYSGTLTAEFAGSL